MLKALYPQKTQHERDKHLASSNRQIKLKKRLQKNTSLKLRPYDKVNKLIKNKHVVKEGTYSMRSSGRCDNSGGRFPDKLLLSKSLWTFVLLTINSIGSKAISIWKIWYLQKKREKLPCYSQVTKSWCIGKLRRNSTTEWVIVHVAAEVTCR